ncbi:MAG: TetR/AcrR family transcriptional regulator [Myxococcales bacterium]|nr:TetR/AcrR family transcriptional regulator [Myxococcales bacterium]MCB9578937.1 TetR/AcrR family transcriptional regulator [Polyangiaceae bacterium]
MSPVASPDRASQKRDALLDAALELFAERGFHGTAVPEVAERAGVAAGTLYRYFDSKEALVNALYQREKQAFVESLRRDFPAQAPPREQFSELWKRLVTFALERPQAALFMELHHHGSYLDATSRALEEAAFAPVIAFVQRGQEQQALKPVEPMLLISLVYGAFTGMAKAALTGQLTLSPEALAIAEGCLWEAVRL